MKRFEIAGSGYFDADEAQAEIDRLKAENAELESKYAARCEALEFLNGARQEWYEMYMQKREAIAAFRAGLIRAGAKAPIDPNTMNAHQQGLTIALVCLDSELERTAKLKFDLEALTLREAIAKARGES